MFWLKNKQVESNTNKIFSNNEMPIILNCAYRTYDLKKGGTGGPGGVLHQVESIFKSQYKGIDLKYIYKTDIEFSRQFKKKIDKYVPGTKMVLQGCEYINELFKNKTLDERHKYLFVCHDLGTACAAYLKKYPYVIVWHQQGSLLNEFKGFGDVISEEEELLLAKLENDVLSNAKRMYFPSYGAKESFKKTTKADITKINFALKPLYNTIPEEKKADLNKLLSALEISEKELESEEVFVSIGDWTDNKGMDQIPGFLEKYVETTGKKIMWIAVGNKTNSGIYEKLCQEKDRWKFKSTLVGKRLPHELVLKLLEISTHYIMLHRHSIFDLSTLEAMRAENNIILSAIEGNLDFNVKNNIILVESNNFNSAINALSKTNIVEKQILNRKIFEEYFSKRKFFESYCKVYDDLLKDMGVLNEESEINAKSMGIWKQKYIGKTAVICGGGKSLIGYCPLPDAFHIALNSTLFNENIKFDALFMQDRPINSKKSFEEYDKYDCLKFYGKITFPKHQYLSLNLKDIKSKNTTIYELSNLMYDLRIDKVPFDSLDTTYFADANSVLFSAIQFCVFAGFKKIFMVGIDYSNENYDNSKNKSIYAQKVLLNLESFKFQLSKFHPEITFEFLKTTNNHLLQSFKKIDMKKDKIVVTGIFTENYRNIVNMQINSCMDEYYFDYKYISDEQWALNKTSNEFAFFGGNIIKTQAVIEKIMEYWGKIILVTDADVVFLKKTRDQIIKELGDKDIIFLKERANPKKNPYEKTTLNINIGFVAIRCNGRSLRFWQEVQNQTFETKGWDQEITNLILQKGFNIKYSIFSDLFLNGNDITKDNVKRQLICTACGTIAKRQKLTKEEYLYEIMNMANGKQKKWFDGSNITE